ncbi:MAG: D-alanine--D-alanine ligase [bacterium]|nr:D-alanine--D-alanine ligase [bacterium]
MMTRVAVLRGGPSSEYDVSLKTGANVLAALAPKYKTKDILISKDGTWHMDGIPATPEKIARGVDVVFIALHGEYGEDGQVQRILHQLKVPYTGSEAWPSSVALNKALTKDHFRKHNIRTPHGMLVCNDEDVETLAARIFNKLSPPWFVKPNTGGSSIGAGLAKDIQSLINRLQESFKYSDTVIVEEAIMGREATCGVIDNFRNKKHYALFPIEIIKPKARDFFDYECKYDGSTQEICPGNFTAKEKQEMQNAALKVHKALGLRHYSRTDFIVSPRGIYTLEVNTLPGLTSESLFPKAMAAVGTNYLGFLEHLINLALKK